MNFSPETALAYARALARPRRVGSGEDERVAQEIAARLEQFGYHVERQPFEFSTALRAFIALEILAGQLLILAALWASGARTWAPPVLAALLLSMLLFTRPLNRAARAGALARQADERASRWSRLCLRLGSRHRAANLIAALPSLPDDAALPCLYLVAHYDSKSQRLSLAVRIALFVVALAGALIFAGLTLLRGAVPAVGPLSMAFGLLALLAGLPLIFLQDVGNASPGAIDNASGVGLVLHVAECWSRRPEWHGRLRLKFLITAAEEMGVMGAAAYVRAHEPALRRQTASGGLRVLNLDGIGVRGRLCAAGEGRLLTLIRQTCAEQGIPLGRFALPGTLFDHLPFADVGLDAMTLLTVGRASWWVHTRHDAADRLEVEGFWQAGRAVLGVIDKLAARDY